MVDKLFLRHLWESRYCPQKRVIWPLLCDNSARPDVYHTGSVSAWLVKRYGGEVVVRDVQSGQVSPTREERALIGRPRCHCRVREVELSVEGVTRVLARTVMEAHSVCLQISQSMMHDYSNPIGRLLYVDRRTHSTIVGFKCFVTPDCSGVGRRRIIDYRDYRLCITEFFPVP